MTPKPQDPYGVGKYASELLIKSMADPHEFEYVIGIPHNIIGPRQKYDDPFRNVASIFINLMLQNRQPVIYGNGEQMRCFSFVQDTLDPLVKLGFKKGIEGELFNLGPDEEFITINQLAVTIAELLDFDLNIQFVPGRPQEVFLANCSAEKSRKVLGYETKYTLKQGLDEMIDWIRKRGVKPFKYHLDLEVITEKTPVTWKEKIF